MKILEQAKKAMETLPPSELTAIYDMMLSMKKRRPEQGRILNKIDSYKKVRAILINCPGNLSDDVLRSREDRI